MCFSTYSDLICYGFVIFNKLIMFTCVNSFTRLLLDDIMFEVLRGLDKFIDPLTASVALI